MEKNNASALFRLIMSMAIFGTIGIFVRHIPLPSSVIACVRGLVGMAFLLLVMRLTGQRASVSAIRANLPRLCASGAALGLNWILLFEAYRCTSVATATLCYYFAPIIVMLVSPFLLGERLTARKAGCILTALLGMVFVSGVTSGSLPAAGELWGILFGLAAACLYAAVVLINKGICDLAALDRTVVQLGVSAAVLLPYILATENLIALLPSLSAVSFALLAFVAVVHTGVAYALYFSSIQGISAQTAALFSYIDPVVAILLSALLLGESLTVSGAIGAALVLGSALVSELPGKK